MSECIRDDDAFEYNYLIFGVNTDFALTAYHELALLPNVHFQAGGLGYGGWLVKLLFRLNWSGMLNQKLRLPGKRLWFRRMCAYDFHNNKPTCYFFYSGQYITMEPSLRDYIKKQNPRNKIVIRFGDLIEKKHYKDFEAVRRCADLLTTYEPSDAEKYGISLYDKKIYSRICELTEPEQFEYDVYFIGYAKNRLSTILDVHRVLTDAGLRCCFDLVGVPAKQRRKLSGINYIAPIAYKQSLARLLRAKCVLEICQKGASGSTLRAAEAVTYHRLLLSNSPTLQASQHYIPQVMSSFCSPADINVEFLRSPIDYAAFRDTEVVFSPVLFLRHLDHLLSD